MPSREPGDIVPDAVGPNLMPPGNEYHESMSGEYNEDAAGNGYGNGIRDGPHPNSDSRKTVDGWDPQTVDLEVMYDWLASLRDPVTKKFKSGTGGGDRRRFHEVREVYRQRKDGLKRALAAAAEPTQEGTGRERNGDEHAPGAGEDASEQGADEPAFADEASRERFLPNVRQARETVNPNVPVDDSQTVDHWVLFNRMCTFLDTTQPDRPVRADLGEVDRAEYRRLHQFYGTYYPDGPLYPGEP